MIFASGKIGKEISIERQKLAVQPIRRCFFVLPGKGSIVELSNAIARIIKYTVEIDTCPNVGKSVSVVWLHRYSQCTSVYNYHEHTSLTFKLCIHIFTTCLGTLDLLLVFCLELFVSFVNIFPSSK